MLVLLFNAAGCGQAMKPSWHQKFQWKADDYFDDRKVLELCAAIEANDLEKMKRLLDDGADANAKGKDNMTPLLWAFPDNKPERFGLLLERGADPNVFVESDFNTKRVGIQPGDSVTQMAAKSAFPQHFDLVMGHGGDVNLINPVSKETLLETVITSPSAQRKQRLQTLIDKGVDLDQPCSGGTPALLEAFTWFAQYDMVILMLESGADPGVYLENHNMKLVHRVIGQQRKPRPLTPQQKQDFETIVKMLKERGESFEAAEADIERWASWGALPLSKQRELREAETAARHAKQKQNVKNAEP